MYNCTINAIKLILIQPYKSRSSKLCKMELLMEQPHQILKISPEGLDLANAYLEFGSLQAAAKHLFISVDDASTILDKPEVKRYIDNVYMDTGYRNKHKLGALMDEIINSKLEEARESEMFSSKDLLDILALAHKMRMEEIKAEQSSITSQTNIQINESPFGEGNYGKLMEKLVGNTQNSENLIEIPSET